MKPLKPHSISSLVMLQIFFILFSLNHSYATKFYWVNGTGNWSDFSNHWSTTSGGPADAPYYPQSQSDSALFDVNSFTAPGQSVAYDIFSFFAPGYISFSGVQFNPSIVAPGAQSGIMNLSGHLYLSPGMTWDPLLNLEVQYGAIYSAGVGLGSVDFGMGPFPGTYYLLDDLNCGDLEIYGGTLNTNDHNINCMVFSAANNAFTTQVSLGESTVTCADWYVSNSSGLPVNVDASNAVIIIDDPLNSGSFNIGQNESRYYKKLILRSASTYSNNQYADTIHVLELEANAQLSGVLIVDSLILNNPGHVVSLGIIKINDAIITNGMPSFPVQLNNMRIYKSYGDVCLHDLILQNVKASGVAHFYAGTGSTDLGGNVGWNFTSCGSSPSGYYWVGNSGNWSDVGHWATSSGGNVFHALPPGVNDDIYIDENSFSSPGNTITIDIPADARNLYFNEATETTEIISSGNHHLKISGSAILNPLVTFNANVYVEFNSTTNINLIESNGVQLGDTVVFNGTSAEWRLIDNFQATNFLNVKKGNLYTENKDITCKNFLNASVNANVFFGTSSIYCRYFIYTPIGSASKNSEQATIFLNEPDSNFIQCSGNLGVLHTTGKSFLNQTLRIRRVTINDNAEFINNSFIDTLVLDNSGDTLKLRTGITLTINDLMVANSLPGNPVMITSTAGFATIAKSAGEVCLQDVKLQNVIGSGGAQFFAGGSSIDLGGNTGWVFGPCSVISDVWPGDTDYDLSVNNRDILNIGIAFGETGPVRSGASLAYVPQPATDWSSYFQSGVNKKHADTDGDGAVGFADTAAVTLNYGQSHPPRFLPLPLATLPGPQLYIDVVPDSAGVGDSVAVNLYLGTASAATDSIYGIAFTLNFNPALVDSTSVTFDYSGTWLGTPGGNLITFQYVDFAQGKVDMAFTRTDHTNVAGFGYIGKMGIVIVDNVGARMPLPFTISNITAITANEYLLGVTSAGDTVSVDTLATGIFTPVNIDAVISLYPNPSKDVVNIRCGQIKIQSIELISHHGMLIQKYYTDHAYYTLPVNYLQRGIYIIRITTEKGTINKKLIVY